MMHLLNVNSCSSQIFKKFLEHLSRIAAGLLSRKFVKVTIKAEPAADPRYD